MKKIFLKFLIFVTIYSCNSSKKDVVDVDEFIKVGKKIELVENENSLQKEISLINKVNTSKYQNIVNWTESNLNSKNLIQMSKVDLYKKKKSISKKFQKVLFYNNHFVAIDRKSNLFILNDQLKYKRKIKIYPNKITKNYDLIFSILIVKNNIIIADNIGYIRSINFNNLKTNWSKNLAVPFKSSLKTDGINVFAINSNSKIYSFKVSNGEINWSYITSSSIIKNDNSYQLALHKNNLFIVNDSAELYSIDLNTKNINWTLSLEFELFKVPPINFNVAPLVLTDDTIYLSSNYGYTYAINIKNGSLLWSKKYFTENRFVVSGNNLFFINKKNLFVVNKNNGEILYNYNFLKNLKNKEDIYIKSILLGKNHIYLFSNSNDFIKINKNNFKNYKFFKLNATFSDYIIFNNSLALITNNSFDLY